MGEADGAAQRERSAFGHLTPEARSLLANGVKQWSDAGPPRTPATSARPVTADMLAAALFAPIRIFVASGPLAQRTDGRIPTGACFHIWTWLQRDVARGAVEALLGMELSDAELERRVAVLRSACLEAATALIRETAQSDTARRRLYGQLGGEDGLLDLKAVIEAFRRRDWAVGVAAALPAGMTRRDLDDQPALLAPLRPLGAQPRAAAAWAFAALMPALETPSLLARIAVALAGSDSAGRIEQTAFAGAVDIMMAEIGIEAARCADGTGQRGRDLAALERFHGLVRDLAVLDLSSSRVWMRQLVAAKSLVGTALAGDVAAAPGLTRRVLRARNPAGEVTLLEPDVAEDACRALACLVAAGKARESLPLNALIAETGREIDQAFHVLAGPLFDQLRGATGEDRRRLMLRSDAAIRLAELYFGSRHAASLRRSREAAAEISPHSQERRVRGASPL